MCDCNCEHAAPTASIEVRRWQDAPERGRTADDWPYPTVHVEYLITGSLADRIRSRTHQEGDVYFEEQEVSGGYSEYTQDNDFSVVIRVGRFEREFSGQVDFNGYAYRSAIPEITSWLDEA